MKERTTVFAENIEPFIDRELVRRPHPVFFEMEEYASLHKIPIITSATGAVLHSLVSSWKPEEIWELGTGIGYSTLWMALGAPWAKIYTVDRNEFQASLLDGYATEILGEQTNLIIRISAWVLDYMYANVPLWSGSDVFFIDCDKVTYPELWDLVSHHTKSGARIVFDNVLWHGRLMDMSFQKPSDLAVRALWKRVQSSDFLYTLFPVGDGLLVAEKR
jgi:caffeoyl-CoA O-methyltransferase